MQDTLIYIHSLHLNQYIQLALSFTQVFRRFCNLLHKMKSDIIEQTLLKEEFPIFLHNFFFVSEKINLWKNAAEKLEKCLCWKKFFLTFCSTCKTFFLFLQHKFKKKIFKRKKNVKRKT